MVSPPARAIRRVYYAQRRRPTPPRADEYVTASAVQVNAANLGTIRSYVTEHRTNHPRAVSTLCSISVNGNEARASGCTVVSFTSTSRAGKFPIDWISSTRPATSLVGDGHAGNK